MMTLTTLAQDHCGTVEYVKKQRSQKILLESNDQFENWLRQKISEKSRKQTSERTQLTTYQVPVVVHVIHSGEAIGNGANISDAQILSQLKVLNNDYKRLNADASQTPAEFSAVAGSFDIEFVMAKQNPEGLATNGIMRVQGTKTEWTINDNYELKALSYWPAEDYLNIWVCNLVDYLGYAQFPVSSLPGLENSSTNRLTDGVVIWYRTFGSIDDGAFDLENNYNKGRTATHEVGHFFGLRHIWGDDNNACGGNGDYVSDTPDQAGSTSGCPVHPKITCDVHAMFQNYLDYTNDACMNIFTQGQVGRMTTVIENSPRRVSLLTSPALLDPLPFANDLGIKEIIAPTVSSCSNNVTPSVTIRNYGNNSITAAQLQFSVNGALVEIKDVSLNLDPLATATIDFNPYTFNPGTSTATFDILSTNGVADGNSQNNNQTVSTVITPHIALPFSQTFTSPPSDWTILNPDQAITWTLKTAPKETPTNQAIFMNFYDYEDKLGETDYLISPVFDLTSATEAFLSFELAHARFQSSQDGLKVYVVTNCNTDIFAGALIYEKTGADLATTSSTSSAFIPTDATEWRKESINLHAFLGQANVQLAFVGINDWGNNLYLDNIQLQTGHVVDAALHTVSPSLITCKTNQPFVLNLSNEGTVLIQSLDVTYKVNGAVPGMVNFTGLELLPGSDTTLAVPSLALQNGPNTVSLELVNLNGEADFNPANNSKIVYPVVNAYQDRIPYRENFEDPWSEQWTIINPKDGMLWQTTATSSGFDQSQYFNGFNNAEIGDEAWLISPVLDFSGTTKTSLQFYTSYALNSPKSERLKVLYSKDCGASFESTPLLNLTGDQLTSHHSAASWTPEESADWVQHFKDLSGLAGTNTMRFAFVVTNDNGNNLYLDNIDFQTTTTPSPNLGERPYAIYQPNGYREFYLTFNLPERQTVGYEVLDIMGRQLVSASISDALNQTYPVSLDEETSSGVYIVRLQIAGRYYATKVYLSR